MIAVHSKFAPSGRMLAAVVCAGLVALLPAAAIAGHLDESDLREDGLELEVEDLEVERDDDRVRVEYDIDTGDWNRATDAGLSLWLGIFVENGRDGSGRWNLWHSMPLVSKDGSAEYPEYLDLERNHVVARLVAVSNGTLISPGHGLFTDGSMYVAVRGNHSDDHTHGKTRNSHIRRHIELEHRSSALYSVDIHLSYVGSLHKYQWYTPSYGFHRFRTWLQRQRLFTGAFHRHLHHHHRHTCTCGSSPFDNSARRKLRKHHRHHHSESRGGIEIKIE